MGGDVRWGVRKSNRYGLLGDVVGTRFRGLGTIRMN